MAAIIPEVLAFRDKVAAHFAWTSRNRKDNEAERAASILHPLSFVDDAFLVGTFTVALSSDGEEYDSSSIVPWSICKIHERLRVRYWPETKTPSGTD